MGSNERNKIKSADAKSCQSRTSFVLKNSVFGLLGQVVNLLISFASRTVFIYTLGQYYLGLNYLYLDILNVLSFVELGFGSAMTFALYSPVAKNETEKVKQLLAFYRFVYRIVALIIALIGLVILPFLPHFISNPGSISAAELQIYFLIFLANTVVSYFVTYKFGLLNALQKTYVQTNFGTITTCVCSGAQIIVLFATQSFLAYLVVNFILLSMSRLVLAQYLNTKYPMLKEKPDQPLSKKESRVIFHEVKGLAVHQFSSVAVHATDSIIIAVVPSLGIAVVGAVGNYNMIINAIQGIVLVLINSAAAGFGNLAAVESKQHFKHVFDEANFIGFWIFGVCFVCFFALLPSFIELWIGESYVIDSASFILILVNFYLQGQSVVYNNARIAKGDFNRDKWWSLLQAIVNLVVSIVGAFLLGLVGVFIGTVVSRLVFVISRPCSTYRFLFGCSVKGYFKDVAKYCVIVAIVALICAGTTALLLDSLSIGSFCLTAALCFFLSNILFCIATFRSNVFKAVCSRMIVLVKRGD